MASGGMPYRGVASGRSETIYVTPRVSPLPRSGAAWGVAAIVIAILLHLALASRAHDAVRLDCDGGGACTVTEPRGTVTLLEADGSYVITTRAQDRRGSTVPDSWFVSIVGSGKVTAIGLRTQDNAEAFAATLIDARHRHAETHASYRIGQTIERFPLFVGGFGVILLVLYMLNTGRYRFTVDPLGGRVLVTRASGLVAKTEVAVPLEDVAEAAAVSLDPSKAFARYHVVLRDRSGNETKAFPASLVEKDAFAIASGVNDALEKARAVGGPPA